MGTDCSFVCVLNCIVIFICQYFFFWDDNNKAVGFIYICMLRMDGPEPREEQGDLKLLSIKE